MNKIPIMGEFSKLDGMCIRCDEENLLTPAGDLLIIYSAANGFNAEFHQQMKDFGLDKYVEGQINMHEILLARLDKLSRERGSMVKLVYLVDLLNYGWAPKENTDATNKFSIEVFPKTASEIMGKCVMLQTPKAFRFFWKALKPFLPTRTTDRVLLTSSKFLEDPDVKNSVGADALKAMMKNRSGDASGFGDDAMKGIKQLILKGSNFERVVMVEAGQTVSWTFRMATSQEIGEEGQRGMMGKILDKVHDATDVLFEVNAMWDQAAGESWEEESFMALKNIVPPKEIDAKKGEIIGSVQAEKNGMIMLRWGNFKHFSKAGRSRMLATYEVKAAAADGAAELADDGTGGYKSR